MNENTNNIIENYKQNNILETAIKNALKSTLKNPINSSLQAKLEFGIDQTTFTLLPSDSIDPEVIIFEWDELAERIIATFEKNSRVVQVFGECYQAKTGINGYNTRYIYGEQYTIQVSYHDSNPNMGVCINFTAQSLAYYLHKTNMQIYQFLQMIQDELHTIRLSRIDLKVDYINTNFNISAISVDYSSKKTRAFSKIYKKGKFSNYSKNKYDATNHGKNLVVGTLELGTRKSDLFFRFYDKKVEQIEKHGSQYSKALNCDSWLRMEIELKGKYAHMMTEELLNLQSDEELANLIANTILQKYSFFYMVDGERDKPTEYTQAIMNCVTEDKCVLSANKPMSYSIAKSLEYIILKSGLLSTLYKIFIIYGEDALDKLYYFIKDCVKKHVPNKATKIWLKANKDIILENEPNFKEFLNKAVDLDK